MSKASFAAEREAQGRGRSNNAGYRAAWNISEWCGALNLGRSTYYVLAVRPRSIKVGRRLLILESPREFAARIAAMQGAP